MSENYQGRVGRGFSTATLDEVVWEGLSEEATFPYPSLKYTLRRGQGAV